MGSGTSDAQLPQSAVPAAPAPVFSHPPHYVPEDLRVEGDPYQMDDDAAELFMDDDEAQDEAPLATDSDMPVGLLAQIAIECIKFGKHVSEVFSLKRVTKSAAKIRLNPGFAFDFNELDPADGKPRNFNDDEKQKRAFDVIKHEKPYLLIGSPPCRAFNSLFQSNI